MKHLLLFESFNLPENQVVKIPIVMKEESPYNYLYLIGPKQNERAAEQVAARIKEHFDDAWSLDMGSNDNRAFSWYYWTETPHPEIEGIGFRLGRVDEKRVRNYWELELDDILKLHSRDFVLYKPSPPKKTEMPDPQKRSRAIVLKKKEKDLVQAIRRGDWDTARSLRPGSQIP